jgi:hypothetical protein
MILAENPMHSDEIPVAKLVAIEVIGQPIEDVIITQEYSVYYKTLKVVMYAFLTLCCFVSFLFCLFFYPF